MIYIIVGVRSLKHFQVDLQLKLSKVFALLLRTTVRTSMLSNTFARSARCIRSTTRVPTLCLRGSRPISTLPENPQIVRRPMPWTHFKRDSVLTLQSVRTQGPLRPLKIPPLPPPHQPSNTPARNRHHLRGPSNTTVLHAKPPIHPPPQQRLRRTRALRPHGARPSRRLRVARRVQPIAPQRRRGGRLAPGRRRGREHRRMDSRERHAESAGFWADCVAGRYFWESGGRREGTDCRGKLAG